MQDNFPKIAIDSQYLVTDTGTSDGTQIKYYFEEKWYKVDNKRKAFAKAFSGSFEINKKYFEKYATLHFIFSVGHSACVYPLYRFVIS